MSSWMVAIDSAVKNWKLSGHPGRNSFEFVVVEAEVESSLREGAPTAEVMAYVKRRIAFYTNPLNPQPAASAA